MQWFEKISRRYPDFIVGKPGEPYMLRWWVIPRNRFFNIYLHHFMRSDDDRALHDHPWWNFSFLLRGQYTEHMIKAGGIHTKRTYHAGNFKFRTSRTAHRIELTDGPCWTLFITGPKIREWGFHCPKGWRPWQQYVDTRDHGSIGRGCD